jgi:hypothetical protein
MARLDVNIPPETLGLGQEEVENLRVYEARKALGGLIVAGEERVWASGWDPNVGEWGLLIPHGTFKCVVIHALAITGVNQAFHSLVLAGTYVGVHEQLRTKPYVVGVTFEPLARMAARAAGFSHIQPYGPSQAYNEDIIEAYAFLKLSKRRQFQLAMIYMQTDNFVDTYSTRL